MNSALLRDFLRERRWFRGKAKRLVEASVESSFHLDLASEQIELAIVRCDYEDGERERYVLPLARAPFSEASRLRAERPSIIVGDDDGAIVFDALGSERSASALFAHLCDGGRRVRGSTGTLVFRPLPGFDDALARASAPSLSTKEQSNTSIPFGGAYILKILRTLDEGTSAELEMGEFLTRHAYASTPPVVGAIEIESPSHGASTLGVVHRFVDNDGDAWAYTLEAIARDPRPSAYAMHAERLGQRVGEMHVVLAGGTEPAFVPQPITLSERRALGADIEGRARKLEAHLAPGDLAKIEACTRAFVELPHDPVAMRVHGDLHLGQILVTGDDFVLIDFEGEPARSLGERKAKRSPLVDVAGMLRSFDYAAATALRATDEAAAQAWYAAASEAFVRGYRAAATAPGLARDDDALAFFLLEKCVYEIGYEANNRPDWIAIPKGGLARLLASGGNGR